jgi:hypothetical protein
MENMEMEILRIKIDAVPMTVGKTPVMELVVSELSFKGLGEAVEAASGRPEDLGEAILLEQVSRQVRAFDRDGKSIALSALDILQIPTPYAKQIHAVLDVSKSEPGKVIRDADGVSAPILFKLGAPLATGGDSITELEFRAKTLGDISSVYAAENKIDKAIALIEKCATPLGTGKPLLRLPSWALELVTRIDGSAIMREVLPRFL